ncbi:MAG: phosphatase [Desulfobacula sp.]|nr:phosphatase [Desulfobacula sp.]
MKIVKGDLIELTLAGHFDVIIHGCNCFCTMGAGIARVIKSNFPQAFQADVQTGRADQNKLGTYSLAKIDNNGSYFMVINAYTQYDFVGNGVLVDYKAVKNIFSSIKNDFADKRIGYPKIGAGLAKGDWSIISKIIDKELQGVDHTLVEYG